MYDARASDYHVHRETQNLQTSHKKLFLLLFFSYIFLLHVFLLVDA